MKHDFHIFAINNIKLPINASEQEAFSVAGRKLSKIGIKSNDISFSIYKKSVDARNKNDIKFVYSISAGLNCRLPEESLLSANGITLIDDIKEPIKEFGSKSLSSPPLIVGSGPAGLFCALYLAECGYKPVLIERGGSVQDRKKSINDFKTNQRLDINTNIQFGAGGAGTFSDGKLVTRINDPLSAYVFGKLVEFGAPKEIKYLARPHIGTDVLAPIIERILERIASLGGSVHYNTAYIDTKNVSGESVAITTSGEIPYGALILATGHSARDTYKTLIDNGFAIEGKQFSVGMRIEHLTENIDRAMYGSFAGNKKLGHAEYNLSYNTKERGVYTFCMCPGGEVMAAASEEYGIVVNGMSHHARDGINSNSAVVCSVFREDYGITPIKAIEYQRSIEQAAFRAAGGDYSAPIVTVGDFLKGKASAVPSSVKPTYMNGDRVSICSPEKYLPKIVADSIKAAIVDFDKKIKGFASDEAVLTGAETRTSAPVRILRDPETRLALGKDNIYPCGEGAGYAGGITSAAIDGLKTAIQIAKTYKPLGG